MLTVKQMLKITPKNIHTNAEYVRIQRVIRGWNKKTTNPALRFQTVYSTHDHTGKKKNYAPEIHQSYVEGLMGTDTPIGLKYVRVSCTCPYFKFYCEAALHKYAAADIIYSNGERPIITNPRMLPMVCKHLVKVLERIVKESW